MNKGWQTKTLGEVCQLVSGQHIDAKNYNTESRGIGYLTGPSDFGPVSPVVSKWTEHPKVKARHGDILITVKGSGVGKINLLDQKEVAISRQLMAVRVTGAEPRFIYGFLSSTFEHFQAQSTGAAIPGISREQVLGLRFALPPLPEQHRIVRILDEAFDGIATAKANFETNLQNARALFESHLQSVFTQRGEGWIEKPFEELIESNIIGLTKNSREQGEDKAWPYVKMNNITRDNRFDLSSFTCVDATDEEVSKFALRDGDFLFNTRNSYELVGKSCIYESDTHDVVLYNNNIMRVRFRRGIDARFVLLAFSSKGVADELTALKSGTTNVSAIYFKDLKSLVIPVPPIAEQKTIAAKLESLVAETQRLESLYQRKLAALDALKKSLLHQAFSGQLTDHPTGAARAI